MFKKIVITILCVILSAGVLAGCSLFTHNYEADYRQVVVTVNAITDSGSDKHAYEDGYYLYKIDDQYFDENGKLPGTVYDKESVFGMKQGDIYYRTGGSGANVYAPVYDVLEKHLVKQYVDWSFASEKKNIYKSQLVNYVRQVMQQSQQQYESMEALVEDVVDQLVTQELMLVEAKRLEQKGEIRLTQADENTIAKGVYSYIDSELNEIRNKILKDAGKEVPSDETEPPAQSDPTYPILPVEEEANPFDEAPWTMNDLKESNRWPAYSGSDMEKLALEREVMRRFLINLEDNIRADFRLTSAQREKVNADFKRIEEIRNTEGIHMVYPKLLTETFTVEYVYGQMARDSHMLTLLENYINNSLTASREEVLAKFRKKYNEQKASFDSAISNYDSAAGDDVVLYHPKGYNNRHVYVKHILLKFSQEQTDALKKYQTAAYTEERYLQEREKEAKNIIGYVHVNGEDDPDQPRTSVQVMNEVRAAMAKVQNDPKRAYDVFESLLYKYSQDGAASFTSQKGYAIRYKLEEGEAEQYMKEFAEAAREMKDTLRPGQVLDRYIITDYGIHIMYFAGMIDKQEPLIDEYATFARRQTYYDIFEAEVLTEKRTNAFDDFRNERIYYYQKVEEKIDIFDKRFKDLWKD